MKIYEAWDELKIWLANKASMEERFGQPDAAEAYLKVADEIEDLELKHE